jgi:ferric-dicitrate binding protein FerR (iron transport regulator)
MRYDCIRRVLLVVVAGLIFLPAALFPQQNPSLVRSAHLSFVSGDVTVQRPGAAEEIPARVNMPIEEGLEVSTSDDSSASVELENGSMIRLSELTKANFTELNKEVDGNERLVLTLQQGYASFQFTPERQDAYQVKIADATLTPSGKTEFQTGFKSGMVAVHVLAGAISVSAHSQSLTLGKGKSMAYQPSPDAETATSHARVVRLSYLSGAVMVKRPGSAEEEKAMVNTPIQEGFELSTSGGSYGEVEFENGSTARIGELSQLRFHQLALDADGNKLNGITFERGYATFHFLPERTSSSSAIKHGAHGTIYFQPTSMDVYHVNIADATVTPDGKCEFRTDLDQDHFRVEVFNGAVDVVTPTQSSKLGEGKVLEHKTGDTELALNAQKGIVKDAWDQWTEARDKQEMLTSKDEPLHTMGSSYGWSDLNTYGEWVRFPSGRMGWLPYAQAGWSPYTNGRWGWYPGMGYTWISGEPWGWMPYHCGLWDFDASFGWYWMMPMIGCGWWEPSMVNWYSGPGWIGWAPKGPGGPRPSPPGGHPRPGPHAGPLTMGIVKVPTSVVQNRQMITPQIVIHVQATEGSLVDRPPFEPDPRLTTATTSLAPGAGITSKGNTPTGTAPLGSFSTGGRGSGFTSHHGSAPSTILMAGDSAKERALLADHSAHSGHAPLRAAGGTTLGGRYAVHASPGEFRGNDFRGARKNGVASGKNGSVGGPIISSSSGGSGAVIASHGSSGGGSHGGGSSGGRGGYSGSGGGHSGGGGGGYSGGGGGGHSGGGGGGGGGASSSGGGGGGHH